MKFNIDTKVKVQTKTGYEKIGWIMKNKDVPPYAQKMKEPICVRSDFGEWFWYEAARITKY